MLIIAKELASSIQLMSHDLTTRQFKVTFMNLTTIQVHEGKLPEWCNKLCSEYCKLVFSKKVRYLRMFMFSCDNVFII